MLLNLLTIIYLSSHRLVSIWAVSSICCSEHPTEHLHGSRCFIVSQVRLRQNHCVHWHLRDNLWEVSFHILITYRYGLLLHTFHNIYYCLYSDTLVGMECCLLVAFFCGSLINNGAKHCFVWFAVIYISMLINRLFCVLFMFWLLLLFFVEFVNSYISWLKLFYLIWV